MDTTVWERATAHNAEVDRRESRLVLWTAVAVGALLVLTVVGNQLGLTRPVLTFTGSSAGAMNPDTQSASLSLEVRNRGLFPERLTELAFEHPGLIIESAQFRPESLGPFADGFLDIMMTVDCGAEVDGHPVWGDAVVPDSEAPVRITTDRPWGSATTTDASWVFGPSLGWQLVQTAAGACDS